MTTTSHLDAIEDAIYDLLVADPGLVSLVQIGQPADIPNELVWIPGNAETDWLAEEPAERFVEDGFIEVHVIVFRGGDSFTKTRDRAQALTDIVTSVLASDRTLAGTCSDAYVESVHRGSGLTAAGRGIEMTVRVKVEADLIETPVPPPPPPLTVCGPGEIPIPSSIPADESVAVDAQIQAFFDGLPPNAVVCCEPDARYRFDGTLTINLTTIGTLTVNQNGALFHWPNLGVAGSDGQTHRKHIIIQNGTPIWNDLNIVGPYGTAPVRPAFAHTYEDEKGVGFQGTQHAYLNRPHIHGTAGDCTATSEYHPPSGPSVPCTDTHIVSPVFGTCADGAFANANHLTDGVYIEDGDIRYIARAALDFELGCSNIFIRRNTFAGIGLSWVGMALAAGTGTITNVELSDNVVEDEGLFAKFGPTPAGYATGQRMSGFLVQRNRSLVTIGGGVGPVLSFKGVSDVTLNANVQHYSSPRSSGAIAIGGTVAPLDTNYHAQGNDFAGVGTLYPTPADPTWYDDGGNIL